MEYSKPTDTQQLLDWVVCAGERRMQERKRGHIREKATRKAKDILFFPDLFLGLGFSLCPLGCSWFVLSFLLDFGKHALRILEVIYHIKA